MALTKKQEKQQRLFAKKYITLNFNGAAAAIEAGYSEKSAKEQASRLLTKANIQGYISEYIKAREKRTDITADKVVQELAKVAFHDIRKMYNDDGTLKHICELDDETASVLASFKSRKENKGKDDYDIIEEYKRHDKMKSLELLGRHLGIFEKDNEQKPTGNTTVVYIEEDKQS